MSEKKVPTALNFWVSRKGHEEGDILEDLRDFAKLHVAAALKAASEKWATGIPQKYTEPGIKIIKESILSAYPLDLIQ